MQAPPSGRKPKGVRTHCEPTFKPEDAPLNPNDVWEFPPTLLKAEFDTEKTLLAWVSGICF